MGAPPVCFMLQFYTEKKKKPTTLLSSLNRISIATSIKNKLSVTEPKGVENNVVFH